MNALDIAAIGLRQDIERLSLTGHNLANVSTPGYRRQIAVQQPFAALVDGAEAAALSAQTDSRAGKLQATGRGLDLALPEARFLLVERADGSLALTRQGALEFDAQGQLRTATGGHKVLGQRGAIQLTAEQRGTLEFDAQGQLKVQGQVLDALRLVGLKPGVQPQSVGEGLLTADASQWSDEAPAVGLRSGFLEQSNVMASQEMVTLMASTRHAESMVRVFQAADEMMEKAIRRLGENA